MAFAVLSVASTFAYEVGDYVYTATQRFKISGANLVKNGNFSEGLTGWLGAATDEVPDADVWSVEAEAGLGPNGETVIKSTAATADKPLCGVWDLADGGKYVVSIDVKFSAATSTDVSSATSVPNNCIDFFLNTDGALKKVASTDDAPVTNVASSIYCPAEEWKTLVYFIDLTNKENQKLVMRLEKLATDAMFTNIEIHEAEEVYDIRIVQQKIAFAKQLMEDEVFNTADAADAKGELNDAIIMIEGMIEAGEFDDASTAEEMVVAAFVGKDNDPSLLEKFLSVTSTNMNGQIKGIDFTTLPSVGRGRGFTASLVSNINFGDADGNGKGGNWGKTGSSNVDWLMSAIQNGMTNIATFAVFNTDFPAGKYFFAAEMRNAKTAKSSWPCPGQTFNVETTCKMTVGDASIDAVISGEDYQRFYLFGEVNEAGKFRATIDWPGLGEKQGGAFYLRDVQVRYIGEDPNAIIERKQAWDTFTAQWNAAVSNRNKLVSMIGTKELPWGQDSLTNALNNWDKYYNEVIEKGWINSELSDPGKSVVSNEELTDWAKYQGVELYTTPEDGSDPKRLEFQLVRNYQWAITYVQTQNAAITNLAAAIKDAETTRDDAMNTSGDKVTYQKAIDAAQAVYDDVLANTTDAKRDADETRIAAQMEALPTAKEAFLKSAELKPIISIDFSDANGIQELPEEEGTGYYINGAVGRMTFTAADTEKGTDNNNYTLGSGEEKLDVLRVGGSSAVVAIAEADQPGSEDVIRFNFDMWYGNLSGKSAGVELQNAAGERVAGFYFNRYNGTVDYNDFNNADNTGMDLNKYVSGQGSSSVGNAGICVDKNLSSFDLVVDYKAQTLQGTLKNASNGTVIGEVMPFRSGISDTKIAKFVIVCNYGNSGRRCWFDNLVAYKYPSNAEGPHPFGTLGDVNGDGKIDVEDVVAIVNKILGEPAEGFLEAYADVTGDGKIDVDDVVAVVNIILGGSDAAAAAPQLMNILLQNGFKF